MAKPSWTWGPMNIKAADQGPNKMTEKPKLKTTAMILAVFGFLLFAAAAKAELLETRITAVDGTSQDGFGGSVALAGMYAIVGVPGDDDHGSNSGAAYIFWRDGTVWMQQAKLTPGDGAAGDGFGHAVSIAGDHAIVGAPFDDDNGTDSGSAYIFKRDGAVWTQQAKLKPSERMAQDLFGTCVSISGDFALVGAPGDDDNGSASGAAYVFKRDITNWNERAKLTAVDGAAEDRLGTSVSLFDEYALVGVPGDDDHGFGSGAAYVFMRDGENWVEQDKLTADNGAAGDLLGTSVCLSGVYALIGAPGNDDHGSESGAAYMFKRDGVTWNETQKLTAGDGAAEDAFGDSVSIDGEHLVVGAPGDDDHGSGSGSAYIFNPDGAAWSQQGKLTAGNGSAEDRFGSCVAISSSDVLVGAAKADDLGQDSGAAYICLPEGIFGRLTTGITGKAGSPVVGATITIAETAHIAVSDAFGLYRFTDVAPGEYTLVITKPQFARLTIPNISVTTGQLSVVDDQELTILNCDSNSDSALGIEDAINILQVQSGLR
jgi:hypothetical protein